LVQKGETKKKNKGISIAGQGAKKKKKKNVLQSAALKGGKKRLENWHPSRGKKGLTRKKCDPQTEKKTPGRNNQTGVQPTRKETPVPWGKALFPAGKKLQNNPEQRR